MASGPVVGVDIGGTKILAVRLAPLARPARAEGEPPNQGGPSRGAIAGAVEAEARRPTPRDGAEVVARIFEVVRDLCPAAPPEAVGIGIPGLVDRGGVMRFSPHLPGLVGLPVADQLAVGLPGSRLWVGNDATAAGWAEHRFGAAVGADDVLMVTLGTGIGGGIVSGGALNEGADRFAGEFGHMVIDPHGPLCPCGKQGCWERYASGSGLGQLGREAALGHRAPGVLARAGGDPEAVRGEHVTQAARDGDPDALGIMARFAWWLALGLANLANAFDPRVIVLGGGLIEAGDVLLGPVRKAFAELVEAPGERRVRIEAAVLGERAGAIGSGLLAAGGAAA
ncbi:ROK family protein [Acidiferrimicrobium sp. IK]|uniref:ROK family protein n=1 Tax=Acidiferrimicrobium sp. IK TaxID=2871700 RepID=UPI0021CB3354|nr:ROK family protein [Acidiferrimicrobium sp. IK]MCU4184094.1 ROK family protein [Acidiferrimicrobium sp. IK]